MSDPCCGPFHNDAHSIAALGPSRIDDAIAFVAGMDARTLYARFRRVMTEGQVRAHYQGLDPDITIVRAWHVDGTIRALCETSVYPSDWGLEAEIAPVVAEGFRGRGIGSRMVRHAIDDAARRGAVRCLVSIAVADVALQRIVRRLGGRVDLDREIATIDL